MIIFSAQDGLSPRVAGAAVRDLSYEKLSEGAHFQECMVVVLNARSPDMSFHLLPEERLRVLQANDPRRRWHSLDDQRVCVLCGRTITGRQVSVTRDRSGKYSVQCPTEGCPAVPSDWFYQGNACSSSANGSIGTTEANIWNA